MYQLKLATLILFCCLSITMLFAQAPPAPTHLRVSSLQFPEANAIAQTPASYTGAEAAKHLNETATIKDRVDGFHQSANGNMSLNMGGKYPNQAFTAFIPSKNAAELSDAQRYDGQIISVTGKISLYKGKPEIIVTSPSQITAK